MYYIYIESEVQGPFPLKHLADLADMGSINDTTAVKAVDAKEWSSWSEIAPAHLKPAAFKVPIPALVFRDPVLVKDEARRERSDHLLQLRSNSRYPTLRSALIVCAVLEGIASLCFVVNGFSREEGWATDFIAAAIAASGIIPLLFFGAFLDLIDGVLDAVLEKKGQ
jgi:hypothetical protein